MVTAAISEDAAYRNACGHSDRENAVIEGNAAVRRAVLGSKDMELIRLYSDVPEFRQRLHREVIDETYPKLHELLRPLSQEDIDTALCAWNGNIASKHAVIRYMKDHAREKDTAAWLAQEYGGSNSNSLFVVRAGSPEETQLPYMDRPADTREGCKHRCTNAAMEYFKSEVMEMCHREGLYQIDLLNGSKERITEREYWAAKKGQLALDKENAAREAAGQPTKPTKFETDKAKLRRTIWQALSQAGSFDEFSSLLLREGVTVKESRGRLSYLTPDRTKPITARKLGDDFDKAAVLVLLTQNAHRAAEQSKAILEYPAAVKKLSQGEKTTKTTPADNTLQRMVDREAKRAEGKGVGYDRWAAKHNLKQMAATVTAYQQYGFSSPEELDEACSAAYAAMQESLAWLKQVEKTLNGKKELQRQVLAYSKTRPVRDGLKQQKNAKAKAAYRQKHESDFIIADAAARYFRENGISKLPSYKSLQAEIESLIKEKNSGYNDYRAKREEYRRLQTVKGNIDQILRRSEPQRRKEQSHER